MKTEQKLLSQLSFHLSRLYNAECLTKADEKRMKTVSQMMASLAKNTNITDEVWIKITGQIRKAFIVITAKEIIKTINFLNKK